MAERLPLGAGLAAAAVVGAGVWWALRDEEELPPPPPDDAPDDYTTKTGEAVDADTTRDFLRDHGSAVSAIMFDPSGHRSLQWGPEFYQNGGTVVGNLPQLFGAKSYRGSICTLSSEQFLELEASGQGQIRGPSRRHSSSAKNGWEWNQKAWQTGSGWNTNGAPIVARSWSCKANMYMGPNNIKCRTARGSSEDAGWLGLYPMRPKLWTRWRNRGADGGGVPLVEYAGDAGEQMAGQMIYPEMPNYRRMTGQGKGGFLARDGRLWIRSSDSTNFRHVTDEDPNIEYFVAARGQSGVRTARNKVTGKWVERGTLRPRWKDLSNADCLQFIRANTLEKNDPWSISESPWLTLDQMGAREFTFGGRDYSLNFRKASGLNPMFRSLVLTDPAISNWFASGDVVAPSFVSFRNDGLANPWNWPVINYGLVNPYAGQPGVPGAMPVDFGAPVCLNYFLDMSHRRLKFSGDS